MKEDFEKKANKVILFPKLRERFHEQGMNFLHDKKYKDALDTFNQLCNLFDEAKKDSEIQIAIVVCYIELGYLAEAKVNCKRLLNEDIGDYFNTLEIYITILIQLQEYDEAVTIIEAVTHENKLPPNRAEHFFQLLEFCRKMAEQHLDLQNKPLDNNDHNLEQLQKKLLEFLEMKQPGRQIQLLNEIRSFDITYLLPTFKRALEDTSFHPAVKTVILQICIEKQLDQTLLVEKFQKKKEISPLTLEQVFEREFSIRVLRSLEDKLEIENPTLYDVVRQLWEQFLFIVYPFDIIPQHADVWAASLYKMGYDLHGIDITTEEVCFTFNVSRSEVENAMKQINEIDSLVFY